jgi:hypothetical protein
MAAFDILPWLVLTNRSTYHLKGSSAATYFMFDFDPGYPAGFPSGVLFWIKNGAGHPWDIEVYDSSYISHWITEDGDPVSQPACQAAGYNACWNDPYAYKRFLTPVHILPRMYDPSLAPYTIDNPGTNTFNRTTNCETTYEPINLGDVRAVTSTIQTMDWGGNVGVVPTIQNDYYYGGTIPGPFHDKESTFYVQYIGRVAWKYYTLSGGSYSLNQQSINNLIVPGGCPTPVFPCGWSFSGGTSGGGGGSPVWGGGGAGLGCSGYSPPAGNPTIKGTAKIIL